MTQEVGKRITTVCLRYRLSIICNFWVACIAVSLRFEGAHCIFGLFMGQIFMAYSDKDFLVRAGLGIRIFFGNKVPHVYFRTVFEVITALEVCYVILCFRVL